MDNVLTWFINCWVALVVLANVASIVGSFVGAATFWDGWKRIMETYSPFNVANFIMEVVSLSPALGAMYWRDRRRGATDVRESQRVSIGGYKLRGKAEATRPE